MPDHIRGSLHSPFGDAVCTPNLSGEPSKQPTESDGLSGYQPRTPSPNAVKEVLVVTKPE